jgi:phosphoribosylaminoimidazole (AIR) synthetase
MTNNFDLETKNLAFFGTLVGVSAGLSDRQQVNEGTGLGVVVRTGSWTVPFIFTLLQQRGDIEDAEMARTFNLGIGLTAVIPASLTDVALAAVPSAALIGRVVAVEAGEERVSFE